MKQRKNLQKKYVNPDREPAYPGLFNYDTYCGLYCGACSIMIAYKTGEKDPLASYWTEPVLKSTVQNRGIEVTAHEELQLKCHGCKTDDRFINCRDCKIRACARGKNIEHCNLCEKYPCEFFHATLLNEKLQQLLPHLKEIPGNLETITLCGTELWLADQKKKFQCPECGTAFSWYAVRCSRCGHE